jgi:hypothetical protein
VDKTEIFNEIIDILDKLIEIDTDRKARYQDQSESFLFYFFILNGQRQK